MSDCCGNVFQAAAVDHLDCLKKFKKDLPSETLWAPLVDDIVDTAIKNGSGECLKFVVDYNIAKRHLPSAVCNLEIFKLCFEALAEPSTICDDVYLTRPISDEALYECLRRECWDVLDWLWESKHDRNDVALAMAVFHDMDHLIPKLQTRYVSKITGHSINYISTKCLFKLECPCEWIEKLLKASGQDFKNWRCLTSFEWKRCKDYDCYYKNPTMTAIILETKIYDERGRVPKEMQDLKKWVDGYYSSIRQDIENALSFLLKDIVDQIFYFICNTEKQWIKQRKRFLRLQEAGKLKHSDVLMMLSS